MTQSQINGVKHSSEGAKAFVSDFQKNNPEGNPAMGRYTK